MSCFVPTNLVVVAVKSIIFWQWANQIINVAINYSNANKTIMMSLKETAIAYASAVTKSCGLAVGLTQAVPRLKSTRGILAILVPFVAVASAGTVNVYLMRLKEIRNGIDVYDADGIIWLEKTILLKNNPKLAIPINLVCLITLSLTIALPLAIAAFPQKAVIDPLKLEDTFWNLKDKNGEAIRQ
ncbi:22_t:CDS:2, partial [Scutellospora calospora]